MNSHIGNFAWNTQTRFLKQKFLVQSTNLVPHFGQAFHLGTPTKHPLWFPFRGPLGSFPHSLPIYSTSKFLGTRGPGLLLCLLVCLFVFVCVWGLFFWGFWGLFVCLFLGFGACLFVCFWVLGLVCLSFFGFGGGHPT